MRVKMLRGFCLGAGRDVVPGEIVELDDNAARFYIAKGKAEAVVETAPPEPEGDEAEPESATPTARQKGRK